MELRLRFSALVVLLFGFTASPAIATAAPLPTGRSNFELPNEGEPIRVFTYKPASFRAGPIVVVVHGSDRNAEDYRNYAVPIGDRNGALIVAPLFDRERFDDERYKRGGGVTKGGKVQPRDRWTFEVIRRLVQDVRQREGLADTPCYVIGHSGGAQFSSRMAMYAPEGVTRFVAANSGSYTYPDRSVKFPYGFGGLPDELASDEVLRRYLAAPLTLYLGTGDIIQDIEDGFDTSEEAMKQGYHRLERGHKFFATMKALAAKRGWRFNWRLVETPGIGHSGSKMFAAPEVGDALFGESPRGRP